MPLAGPLGRGPGVIVHGSWQGRPPAHAARAFAGDLVQQRAPSTSPSTASYPSTLSMGAPVIPPRRRDSFPTLQGSRRGRGAGSDDPRPLGHVLPAARRDGGGGRAPPGRDRGP